MPSGGVANFDHLIPVLSDVERWMSSVEQRPFPRPQLGSALAEDDRRLGIYRGSVLVADGISGAVDHLDTFRHLIVKAQALHRSAPVTLLRAALEGAGLALWLISPAQRQQRLLRALKTHHWDMYERGGYEAVKPPVLGPGGKTAERRRADIRALATALELDPSAVGGRFSTTSVVDDACRVLGPLGSDGPRLWRLSSGIAHGRRWTVPHGYELRGATDGGSGFAELHVAGDEDLVTSMAILGHRLVEGAQARYTLLSQAHR